MSSPRSVEDVIAAAASGIRQKFVFFWGHAPSRDGAIAKSCFSQWWEAPFGVDRTTYPTAEHYMMAAKALPFGDRVALEKILACAQRRNSRS